MNFVCYKPKREIQLTNIDGDSNMFFENETYPTKPVVINGSKMYIITNPVDISRKGYLVSARYLRRNFVPAHVTVSDDDHRIETICRETELMIKEMQT